MDAREKVFSLLREHKCEQIRKTPHLIYRIPGSRQITFPSTPSDHRSWKNALRDLRVALGLSNRGRAALSGPRSFKDKLKTALTKQQPTTVKKITTKRSTARSGRVRIWTPEEIAVANKAHNLGNLDDFMRGRKAGFKMYKSEQEDEMAIMEIATIDTTIAELKAAILIAQEESNSEQALFDNLERQKVEAQQRRIAAIDRSNSMQETIASLELCRENMVKIQPMFHGYISRKLGGDETTETTTTTGKRRHGMVLRGMVQVLERAGRPLTPGELYSGLRGIAGLENYSRNGVYALLDSQRKKNGEAVVRRVDGDGNLYCLATKEQHLQAAS